MRIRILLVAACLFALAIVASPAYANVGIAAFSVTPSNTQAGISSASSGPNLDIDAKFSSSNWDTANKATLSFAPGLLANPEQASKCSAWAFQFNACPGSSQIGNGWTTATAPGVFGFTDAFVTKIYLVAPQGSEPARIGLIIDFFGWPVESATAPVSIRTKQGDVGLDLNFSGLPNLWNGISVVIDELHLTIWGSVNGKVFTRNPTGCQAAQSRLAVVSYGNSASTVTATSPLTPTGCDKLPYTPQLAAAALRDSADSGTAFGVQITQGVFESATRNVTLTTPPSLSPRLLALAAACTATDVSTCPAVGWASATTPLLPKAVGGKLVLIAHPGDVPTLAILFDSPFATRLDSTTTITSTPLTLSSTFNNLPDIPLTNLTIVFNGGPQSMFVAGTHLCTTPQITSALFTAWSGATSQQTATTQILNCPVATTAASSKLAAAVRAHAHPTKATRRTRARHNRGRVHTRPRP